MAAPDVKRLLELDLETRLAIVQELWDSIAQEASAASFPLTDTERELLDQRLREDDDDPNAAVPWSEAKARLRQR